jgi:hypothetical protein
MRASFAADCGEGRALIDARGAAIALGGLASAQSDACQDEEDK